MGRRVNGGAAVAGAARQKTEFVGQGHSGGVQGYDGTNVENLTRLG